MKNEKKLEDLKEMLQIQGNDGNWNYSEYMHGMYNGLEFAVSIIEEREPEYREAPAKWLKDKKSNYQPTHA